MTPPNDIPTPPTPPASKKQYIVLIEEDMIGHFATVFPGMRLLQIEGLGVKNDAGDLYTALVIPPAKQMVVEPIPVADPVEPVAVDG